MKVLWILFVWPEPTSSAAGSRTERLIRLCHENGMRVEICSPCRSNSFQAALESQELVCRRFEPNDSAFDDYLHAYNPDLVFFDRFMVEEQFGWRVKKICPDAIRVLDTVDLQFLRRLRERKLALGKDPLKLLDEDLVSETALRELASIFRCDLSLIISTAEICLLRNSYNVPAELLAECSFFYPEPQEFEPFSGRCNFVSIGNFNHRPNRDAVRHLKEELWPKLRRLMAQKGEPASELHIYGAYPDSEVLAWDNPRSGFHLKGWTKDAISTLSAYRVNLAPLRFGAGLKGKIADGWAAGTPCVATPLAAEGMHEGLKFGGCIAGDRESFIDSAATLYTNGPAWEQARANGVAIIKDLFNLEANSRAFLETIESLARESKVRRDRNVIGCMLWHHGQRSSEYFSRWIELKNQTRNTTNARESEYA